MKQRIQQDEVCSGGGITCSVATNDGIGTVGHISSKATQGKTSVSQRIWLDWFILSESTACVYLRSGFPRMACQASRSGQNLFEKSSCGPEGAKSWRMAATDVA